jgi:anti-anti-sigma regulatory factor
VGAFNSQLARSSRIPAEGHVAQAWLEEFDLLRNVSPALGAYACARTESGDIWQWTPELYRIHGLEPGATEPSVDLIRGHEHPDERGAVDRAITTCGETGEPFALPMRLQVNGAERWVTWTGEPVPRSDVAWPDHCVWAVRGFVIDASEHWQQVVSEQTKAHLEAALASRQTIDMAKGVLMVAYGIDDEASFQLLVWYSQHFNVKIADLAQRITAAARSGSGLGRDEGPDLESVVASLGTSEGPVGPMEAGGGVVAALEVTISASNGGATVSVAGDVDLANAPQLSAALSAELKELPRGAHLTVDLHGVRRLGAVGRALLESVERRARTAGVTLTLEGKPGDLHQDIWRSPLLRRYPVGS